MNDPPTSSLSLLMNALNIAWPQPFEEEEEDEEVGGAGREGMCLRWQAWAASSCWSFRRLICNTYIHTYILKLDAFESNKTNNITHTYTLFPVSIIIIKNAHMRDMNTYIHTYIITITCSSTNVCCPFFRFRLSVCLRNVSISRLPAAILYYTHTYIHTLRHNTVTTRTQKG